MNKPKPFDDSWSAWSIYAPGSASVIFYTRYFQASKGNIREKLALVKFVPDRTLVRVAGATKAPYRQAERVKAGAGPPPAAGRSRSSAVGPTRRRHRAAMSASVTSNLWPIVRKVSDLRGPDGGRALPMPAARNHN